MKRIVVSGIGGVGGFYGGLLAKGFEGSKDVEIFFIARGAHLKAIQECGLRVEGDDEVFTAFPKLATDDANLVGRADLIILCTKCYDLADNLKQLAPCIDGNTVLLPLLNGVDSQDIIRSVYPDNPVWKGCVYVISRLASPGVIHRTGSIGSFFFGSTGDALDLLGVYDELFKAAGIDARLSTDIDRTVWTKFAFISTVATMTSYLDKCLGAILENAEERALMDSLLDEFISIARAMGIRLPDDIKGITIRRMESLTYVKTASNQSVFKSGKRTELESLTGYMVRIGERLNISIPIYERAYRSLLRRV